MAKDGLSIYVFGLVTAACVWCVSDAANKGDIVAVIVFTVFTCIAFLASMALAREEDD